MSSKVLDVLILAEEEAKKYLLPISAKEWAEITGENLRNYNIVSIEAILKPENDFSFNEEEITEHQLNKYLKAMYGFDEKDLKKIGIDTYVKNYQADSSMMKCIMITKGEVEGAKVIVDVKTHSQEKVSYMTGVGLVPLPEEDKPKYVNLNDKLKDMHKGLADEKEPGESK